ncbi:uncharacterized protein METZ01_LOCUS320744, partial [marine metagenome]
RGIEDPRGILFERYVEIVEELRPKGFLYENVYGLVGAQDGEPWRLIKEGFKGAGYKLFHRILDSADYGAPQHRERLIMVGVQSGEFKFPRPTHGPDSTGDRPHFSAGDALLHLPNQQLDDTPFGGTWGHLLPDIPPGLNYSFYTSKLGHPNPVFAWRSKFSDFLYKADPERPVRTIKAQGGKYTGPLHWDNRHFNANELKLLQTFPEDFVLIGSEAVQRAVIGNSVPPLLSRVLGESVMVQIFNSENTQGLTWLGEDEKLSFRSLKRQRTKYYAQKALEAHSESVQNALPIGFTPDMRSSIRFQLERRVNLVERGDREIVGNQWMVEIKGSGRAPSSSDDVLQLHIANSTGWDELKGKI